MPERAPLTPEREQYIRDRNFCDYSLTLGEVSELLAALDAARADVRALGNRRDSSGEAVRSRALMRAAGGRRCSATPA